MLKAEIHGKLRIDIDADMDLDNSASRREIERMEDVLTSNVFGVLKNIDASVMNAVLLEAGLSTNETSSEMEWHFWPRYQPEGVEPDIVIETSQRATVIEVKYESGFGGQNEKRDFQVLREVELASRLGKDKQNCEYLTVTISPIDDISNLLPPERHKELAQLQQRVVIKNITWKQIFDVINKKHRDDSDPVSKKFLKDLVEYLKIKGFGSHPKPIGKRSFEVFFPNTEELVSFLRKHAINDPSGITRLPMKSLDTKLRRQFYQILIEYIQREGNQFSEVSDNDIDLNSVGLGLILDVEDEDYDYVEWAKFLRFLYRSNRVNLVGRKDISARIRHRQSDYPYAASLFTYFRKDRTFEFRLLR